MWKDRIASINVHFDPKFSALPIATVGQGISNPRSGDGVTLVRG